MGANPSMTRPPGVNKSPDPVKKPTLAAVLIVKNEADNLRACLASLEGLADEISALIHGAASYPIVYSEDTESAA